MSNFEVIISVLMGLLALVAGGAIPWAYMVGNRLARIETIVSNGMQTDIEDIKEDIKELKNTKARTRR